MKKNRFIHAYMATAALAVGLWGCSDESTWHNEGSETGSISLTLTTDNDIATEKPVFRSGEDNTRARSGNLGDYMTVPAAADFSIRLEKADGSYAKTWSTLADFQNETKTTGFKTGAYTLTAFYGKKGEQDFAKPYFEASTSFTVVSEKTNEVELTAELKNSLVKVNYTDNFKNYMSAYHTTLRTDGRNEEITFNSTESRPAFIEPKNANLTVHFTTAAKGQTASVSIGEFAPMAKTLHNVTLDVAANQYGTSTLTVSFDSSLTDENIEIDLGEELFVTPPPTVTCEGFENGSTIEMLEGSASSDALKMNIRAKGTIAKAELTVTEAGGNFVPAWCTDPSGNATSGNTIDLCAASATQQAQLEKAGIKAIGLYPEAKPNDMALLDLSQCGKAFEEKGLYTISLIVTDKTGKVSETQSIVINTLPIEIEMVGTPTILYGSGKATITIDYNGYNAATDVTFTAVNANGMHENAPVNSCEEVTSTRSFEKKRYIYDLTLPYSTKPSIEIRAYHHGRKVGEYSGKVNLIEPKYTISDVDAFAHYAYVKITTPDNTDNPSVLAAVTNSIRLKSGGTELNITDRDASNGIVTVTGLTNAGSSYTIDSSCIISSPTENWHTESKTFTTERELAIPNGDFSAITQTINHKDVETGGKYSHSVPYQATADIVASEPNNWASINAKTCWFNSPGAKNTWFQVPSTYAENEGVTIRNVAYDHNGTKPADMPTGLGKDYWYNTNIPTFTDNNFAAGELFLGSYSFDGTEHRTDGIDFSSRPTSISFDYSYSPTGNDKGYMEAKVIDSSGKVISSSNIELTGSATDFSVTLQNYPFGKKASKIVICFRSSSSSKPKEFVHIPQGNELDEGFGTWNFGNKNVGENNYKAVATGSKLWIDNVKVNYESTPKASTASQSPKKVKKTSKRR